MNPSARFDLLEKTLREFTPKSHSRPRAASLYSAAIATGQLNVLNLASALGTEHGLDYTELYELMLQSYLFLGFPRMLIAAEHLSRAFSCRSDSPGLDAISAQESREWLERGTQLYKRVYRDKSEVLRERVQGAAPEVFRWMIIEGYGKVLSRSGLDIVTRELSIVAMLMFENMPRQLHSHMKGALNVGVGRELLESVIEDIGAAAGEGYAEAQAILGRLNNG